VTPEELARLKEAGLTLETVEDAGDPELRRLVLRDLEDPKVLPLAVDFLSPALLHRLRHGIGKNQPLAKALGLRSLDPEKAPYVFDATAGLGVDALMIAALGCRVRSVERSPFVHALLADGFRRFKTASAMTEVSSRLSFERGEAREVLASLTDEERPDVVYLDPMYPEEGRSKSALPKKGMQMFRRLIGDDFDAAEVLEVALEKARDRVVVKRPLKAPALLKNPAHTFAGKTARYDMYLVKKI
jgi:16S rRNA (guanine1516-N2)-methyltransferase